MRHSHSFLAVVFLTVVALWSVECSGIAQISGNPPAAPAGATADPGNGQVRLSWTPVAGAKSYNIHYEFVAAGKEVSSHVNGITGTSTIISGLANSTSYHFVVTAVNEFGEGAKSVRVSATPTSIAPPAAMRPAGNGRLTLSWDAVAGATWYNLYYGTRPGVTTASPLNVKGITTTSHTVTGLSTGAIYFFVVTAANAETESAESREVSGRPKQ